jgi:hypothetical protein
MPELIERQILPNAKDFKRFWKERGPFKYALSSNEFPPTLLEPEEWIFGNEVHLVLKELMQFDQKKMVFVQAPFNPKNKRILRPEGLSPWKINHFPEQWNRIVCDLFVPQGHLTCLVMDRAKKSENVDLPTQCLEGAPEKQAMEKAFFELLEQGIETMGYLLLKPQETSAHAAVDTYLSEWEEDDREAGLL